MLKQIRKTFVDAIGPQATHALEAGVVLSVLVTSIEYFPEYSLLLAGIFGVQKTIKRLRQRDKPISELTLLTLLKAIVPKQHLKDIKVQPIYLIAGTALGSSAVYIAAVVTGRTILFLPI